MEKKAVSGIMLTLLVISVLTLAFNIQPAKAEPKTWYVNDDGGADFTRIQDAINAASSGDTIYVYNGIYFEHLYVMKNGLTLTGESQGNTIIDGGGNVVIAIYDNKVTVSGFTVRNAGASWYYTLGSAILLDYAQYCNISDNIVLNSRYGITSFQGKHNTISGNTIHDANQGIPLYYTMNETAIDNTISNGVQFGSDPPYGVQVWGGYDNRVMGNTITEISYVGISLEQYARNNVIQGNTILNAEKGMILHTSYDNKVSGNSVSNVYDIAIGLWTSYNNIVNENSISYCGSGIYVERDSYANTLVRNIISNDDAYGINVWGYSNAISGNIMTYMGYVGIQLNSPSEYPNQCTNNVASGNAISHSTFGINLIMASFSNTIDRNNVTDNILGILISDHSDNNIIIRNLVSNNYYGILLFSSDNTKVYHNNFIDNTQQVLLSDSFNTIWDDGYPSGGNYWSDYTDTDVYNGPDQDLAGSDGIWDHPYVINIDNADRYPFSEPWAPTISAAGDIDPYALNLNSHGRWITAYIELPEGHGPSEIDVSTIKLNGTIPVDPEAPTAIGDYDVDGIPDLMVKFNRTEVAEYVKGSLNDIGWRFSDITFIITGKLNDGTRIKCSYMIKAIKGDVNGDGNVDIVDLATVARDFGTSSQDTYWNPQADINQDNAIDIDDLILVSKEYGTICP